MRDDEILAAMARGIAEHLLPQIRELLGKSPSSSAEVPEYLTTKQAAAFAKLGRSTLENYRRKNIGPKWTKLRTGQVRYKRADLEAYLARKDSK